MSVERKPNKVVTTLILSTIRRYLRFRSKVVIEQNDTLNMEPPYLILANHVNNWDPFFINCFVDEPICFIAGESLFHNPLLKKVLNYAGVIPKTKFKSDTRTIRGVLNAKKHHRIIALFPEGNRNWDGSTEPIIFATAKLVKLLNLPVVIANISGGYLSHPRWAAGHRRGVISISFKKMWDTGAFVDEKPEDIHLKLTQALAHNEIQWQEKHNIPYTGKNLANYLERFLFICPHCGLPGSLHSEHDLFSCKNCDYTVRYTQYGTLEEVRHPIQFKTTREWNQWQLDFLEKSLLDGEWKNQWDATMNDHVKMVFSRGEEPFQQVSEGTLGLEEENLILIGDNGQKYSFPLSNLKGLNIHLNNHLDFYYKEDLYRITFYQPRTSAYKYYRTIQILLKLNKMQEEI